VTNAGAPTRSAVGRLSHLDASSRARLEAACGFINAERDKVRGRILRFSTICAAVGLVAYIILWKEGIRDPRLPLVAVLFFVGMYAGFEYRKLAKTYKQVVIGRICAALGQGLSYSPESRFTKDDFVNMDLFLRRVERWKAEDEVCGRRNAVAYSLFEAKATRTEGSGKNRRTVTIFQGQIVRLDFNKHFQGHTIVVPNSDSQILGGLFGESESRGMKELCRMDNVTFEEAFSVYSTDQQEARYVLTPKMMELILSTQATFGAIRCSFHDSSLFITIPGGVNRFEVRLWGPKMSPESAVGELAECVDLAERLIDTLDLETRIWTKV
jgi:hypothetical protein